MASDSDDDYLGRIDGDTMAESIAQSMTNILVESANEDFHKALFEVTHSRSRDEFKKTVQTRLETFLEADAKRLASAQLSKQSILVKASEQLKSRARAKAFKGKYKKQEASVLTQRNNNSVENQLEGDDFSEAASEWDDAGDGFTSSDFDIDSDMQQPIPAHLLREDEVKREPSPEDEFTPSEDEEKFVPSLAAHPTHHEGAVISPRDNNRMDFEAFARTEISPCTSFLR